MLGQLVFFCVISGGVTTWYPAIINKVIADVHVQLSVFGLAGVAATFKTATKFVPETPVSGTWYETPGVV